MEFVDGKTLVDLNPRNGMRAPDALKIAVQMADALAAAHGASIVHRDFKPGHVMVSAAGHVKALDFGLAKLIEAPAVADATTLSLHALTEEGTVMGTVAYMSPELAEGKLLDARSDIFSFGSTLYEMLSGQRAFSGDSKASTLAAVLDREPKPLTSIVPREVERIVALCLRKDRDRRLQHMADVKVLLDRSKDEVASGVAAAASPSPHAPRNWWMVASVVTALVAAGALFLLSKRGTPKAPALLTNLRAVTRDAGLTGWPALSHDGKLLAYASDRGGDGASTSGCSRWPEARQSGLRVTQRTIPIRPFRPMAATLRFAPSAMPEESTRSPHWVERTGSLPGLEAILNTRRTESGLHTM